MAGTISKLMESVETCNVTKTWEEVVSFDDTTYLSNELYYDVEEVVIASNQIESEISLNSKKSLESLDLLQSNNLDLALLESRDGTLSDDNFPQLFESIDDLFTDLS